MIIAGKYSFNNGLEVVQKKYSTHLAEIEDVIAQVNASELKTKESEEKTMPGQLLYSPPLLNKAFDREFLSRGWDKNKRVPCDYPTQFYVDGYKPPKLRRGAFRAMDFLKGGLGVEVQLGKYSFMVYNVCAKMTIFHKLGFLDTGIEIVPMKEFANEMSSGVSYFEQFVWDLEHRGVADIDIPVLVLGICAKPDPQ